MKFNDMLMAIDNNTMIRVTMEMYSTLLTYIVQAKQDYKITKWG